MAESALRGIRELNQKLSKLSRAVGIRTLGAALNKSVLPVKRQMKSRIPVGSEPHRTYRKRLVSPGFAKRSIKHVRGRKFINKGKLSVAIGVKKEAFYAINLLDQGPHTITRRRQQTNIKARGHVGYRRRNAATKPYTLRRRPWFQYTFIANRNAMVNSFRGNLKVAIERAVK